ncbi:polynucleotide kinase [Gordonia phage MelBins]|uniref:Polynucleotide kinase n=1 Tax=Gordonia phage MelBins TaxID=2656540 RepID=A0A649VMH5_9CAUD|nr:polynucleotide kinase [Gordonia phage MelBins]QGJ93630.1 polynucleotide kinase [Gordonia phage MelBins]
MTDLTPDTFTALLSDQQPRPTAVIVDMDGTLCDVRDALVHLYGTRKDMRRFHEATRRCPPTPKVVRWCEQAIADGHRLLLVTARKYELEQLTREWLAEHVPHLEFDHMLMRGDHDDRHDDDVKRDILRIIRDDHGYDVVEAFDDRPRVIRLWRSLGIPVRVVYRPDWEAAGEPYTGIDVESTS